jgi:hypothetical protein
LTRFGLRSPHPLAQIAYADPERMTVTIVHVFGDANSVDVHNEGSDQRSNAAYEFVEPLGGRSTGDRARQPSR